MLEIGDVFVVVNRMSNPLSSREFASSFIPVKPIHKTKINSEENNIKRKENRRPTVTIDVGNQRTEKRESGAMTNTLNKRHVNDESAKVQLGSWEVLRTADGTVQAAVEATDDDVGGSDDVGDDHEVEQELEERAEDLKEVGAELEEKAEIVVAEK